MERRRQFIFVIFTFFVKSSAQENVSSHYWKCSKGDGIFQGNVSTTMTNSYLRCFAACSADPACNSLNVCPSASEVGQFDCQLITDKSLWFCRQLNNDAQYSDCYHAEKTTKCGKGGRLLDDGTCRCDLCYRGDFCRYHVRDCKEAYDLASLAGGYSAQVGCYIQPNGAPEPFLVRCALWGTGTTFLIRVQNEDGTHWSGIDWASKGWEDYKRGVGSLDIYNFFSGLENLHYLLAQADYRLLIYYQFHSGVGSPEPCGPAYANTKVDQESGDYALTYAFHTLCNSSEISGLNGLYAENTPHHFCTADHDCGTCAKDNGPGWYYVPGCIGYSPFAPIAKWPYFWHGDQVLKDVQYYVERDGPLF